MYRFFLVLVAMAVVTQGCATTMSQSPRVVTTRTECVGPTCSAVPADGDTVAGVPVDELVRRPGVHSSALLEFDTPSGPASFRFDTHAVPERKNWCQRNPVPCALLITAGVGVGATAIGVGIYHGTAGGESHVRFK